MVSGNLRASLNFTIKSYEWDIFTYSFGKSTEGKEKIFLGLYFEKVKVFNWWQECENLYKSLIGVSLRVRNMSTKIIFRYTHSKDNEISGSYV